MRTLYRGFNGMGGKTGMWFGAAALALAAAAFYAGWSSGRVVGPPADAEAPPAVAPLYDAPASPPRPLPAPPARVFRARSAARRGGPSVPVWGVLSVRRGRTAVFADGSLAWCGYNRVVVESLGDGDTAVFARDGDTAVFEGDGGRCDFDLHAAGTRLALASNEVAVWDRAAGHLLWQADCGSAPAPVFSPDGRWLVAVDQADMELGDGVARVCWFDARSGERLGVLFEGAEAWTAAAANNPDPPTGGAAGGPDTDLSGEMQAWWSSDGRVLFTRSGSGDDEPGARRRGVIRAWNAADRTPSPLRGLYPPPGKGATTTFGGDRVTLGADGTVLIAPAGGGPVRRRRPDGPSRTPTGAAFSPDGRLLAVADGYEVSLRAADDLAVEATIVLVRAPAEGDTLDHATPITWSADGRRMAVVDADDAAVVIDATARAVVLRVADGAAARVAALSPDGRRLAVGRDGVVMWDVGGATPRPAQ